MRMSNPFDIIETRLKNIENLLLNPPKVNTENIVKKNDNKLLTKQEACKLLSISIPTLNSRMKKGLIVGYRLDRRIYFKSSEIEQSLKPIKY